MKQALTGLRVLDFTQVMAGPFCAMLLGDLGAEVIKVEAPGGDSIRKIAGGQDNESPGFWALNRNKRGIVINLKDARGREIVRALSLRADVLIENFRPGVMSSLGLGYDDLREAAPSLIYASISGFGQTGPYAQRGGFDLVAQGMSGIMSVTGEPCGAPVKCGIPVTDLGAGLFAMQAILAAYIYRLKTGEGQYLDTSLLETGIALSVWESTEYFSTGETPQPVGSAHRMFAPYQAIRCADGYINLGSANQRTWERFADAIGKSDMISRPDYKGNSDRLKNRKVLIEDIERVTVQKSREHWLSTLERASVPCGPILDYSEVFNDPHVLIRGMVQQMVHPVGGQIKVTGSPVKFSETPAVTRRPAPLYGQHTAEVLGEIGVTPAEIDRLAGENVIVLGAIPEPPR